MERKLDDIELEEFVHFHIDQTTLIVRTNSETISYSYPNSLELLRRIGYLLHRYEVEYNRKEEQTKAVSKVPLTPIQKECQKRLLIGRNIVFGTYFVYILLTMLFPNITPFLFNIFLVIDGVALITGIKNASIIRSEALKQEETKQNNQSQLEKGFESLKETALSYLNKIMKDNTKFTVEEKHYIEVIEKGFQKRIGTYPQQ